MKSKYVKQQRGIGLIEVLITTVVVAIGLLAVASLQSELMSNSGNNKIRSEALALAEQKQEEFRNNIATADYNNIADGSDTVNGTNAVFTRSWDISDSGSFIGPGRKKVSVQIGWDADGNGVAGETNDERVVVVSEMAWVDPAKSALYAAENSGAGTSATPSPRQNASEDVASEKVIGTDMNIIGTEGMTAGTAGVDSSLTVAAPHEGTFINIVLNQVAPGSHYYTATRDDSNLVLQKIEPGVIAVFICDNGLCTHIQNHFGGVVLRQTGTVYSSTGKGLDHIQVAWTSSEVNACYNSPVVAGDALSANPPDHLDHKNYECVFAGNCDATADADRTRTASGSGATNVGCFVQSVVSNAQIAARNVGPGGEFGDVGLLGVKDSTGGGFKREEVCFLEDTASETTPIIDLSGSRLSLDEDYLLPVTKRFYVTRRIKSDGTINTQKSEGINRSYAIQNFLIVERLSNNATSGSCRQVAVDKHIVLAPRTISRIFDQGSSSDNNVPAPSAYPGTYGTAVVTVDDIDSNKTDLRFYVHETGSCYQKSDASKYVCVVSPGTTSLTVKAGSASYPLPANVLIAPQTFADCSPLPSADCHWPGDF